MTYRDLMISHEAVAQLMSTRALLMNELLNLHTDRIYHEHCMQFKDIAPPLYARMVDAMADMPQVKLEDIVVPHGVVSKLLTSNEGRTLLTHMYQQYAHTVDGSYTRFQKVGPLDASKYKALVDRLKNWRTVDCN
ncbi:hypothetical protein [Stenotrophomonas phage YB07]|uniref:Uncharacterized protein n=1 Tax=Stenotrophomonas phage YB07 TaxID=2555548 RepID=A0A482IEN9_9CAUD|nr:hypothetical protein HWC11_gp226 [Stenotrophomonas phage YB07]QBP06422.1 hypothetical protein [Stenotrophomonas phage YB07]